MNVIGLGSAESGPRPAHVRAGSVPGLATILDRCCRGDVVLSVHTSTSRLNCAHKTHNYCTSSQRRAQRLRGSESPRPALPSPPLPLLSLTLSCSDRIHIQLLQQQQEPLQLLQAHSAPQRLTPAPSQRPTPVGLPSSFVLMRLTLQHRLNACPPSTLQHRLNARPSASPSSLQPSTIMVPQVCCSSGAESLRVCVCVCVCVCACVCL